MELTQVTIFVLFGILCNLPGSELCRFGVGCDYPCHCQNNAACNVNDGSCSTGCDDGDLMDPYDFWYTGAWYGYGCQIGNVAYGKAATQGPATYQHRGAELAVDGRLELTNVLCTHTTGGGSGWWEVDLGTMYIILAVNITNRIDCGSICLSRATDMNITVSENQSDEASYKICNTIGSEGARTTSYVECQSPQRGRYARLKRFPGGSEAHYLHVCEVQVYGYLYSDCPDGHFGVACNSPCNCKGPCDDINGICFGQVCDEGWQGIDCQTVCPNGTWGSNCGKRCTCMNVEEVCDHYEGRCMSGCYPGFGGIGCDLHLPELRGMPELSNASRRTIEIRFSTWHPDRGWGEMPTGYIVQRRKNGTLVWMDALNVEHNPNVTNYSVILGDLEPSTGYYVRVVPFIEDAGGSYRGVPTEEVGPFSTLYFVLDNKRNDIGMIVGVVLAMIFVAILVIILAVVLRRHLAPRQNKDNEPAEFDVMNPDANGDQGKGDGAVSQHDASLDIECRGKSNLYRENPTGYIAASIRTTSNITDFWDMVWRQRINRIVLISSGKEKTGCDIYAPERGVMDIGQFKVSMVSEKMFAEYTITVLSLMIPGGEARPIYQFKFTGWPEKEVPEASTSLLQFRRKLCQHKKTAAGPLLVVSSPGDGRAATFIGVDHLIDMTKTCGTVDVTRYASSTMKWDQTRVETSDQYEFIYKAVLEACQTVETVIPAGNMLCRYVELKQPTQVSGESKLGEQFVLLEAMKRHREFRADESSLFPENIAKNRDEDIIARNKYRVFLHSPVNGTSDYINAVSVYGFIHPKAFIATQLPLPQTIVDIWRLVYECNCSCIIKLEEPESDDVSTPVYWPTNKNKPIKLQQLTVTLLKEEEVENGLPNMAEFEVVFHEMSSHKVRMYHFLDWPSGSETPASLENTIKLLDHGKRWHQRAGHDSIVFQCKYGYKRCGLMIAASLLLEKLQIDDEVDVFQAVQRARFPRPEMVTSLSQYEFLHELAIAYIESNEDYSNFK